MITGRFKTIDNKICEVTINCNRDITLNETDGYYFTENPVEISLNNSDTFTKILKTTCKINILTKEFIPELYTADDREISVTVRVDGKLVFMGYVAPFCYNQPYDSNLTQLTISCQDYLCTLENHKYSGSLGNVSLGSTISRILNGASWNSTPLVKVGTTDALNAIYVNSKIFIGEEKDDLMSDEEVLNIILTYLNYNIIQIGNTFNIFNYKNSTSNNTINPVTLDFYQSNDTQISIADVYNQFIVNCDLDDEEDIVSNPLDTDNTYSPFTNFNKFCVAWDTEKEDEKYDWYIQYYDTSSDWTYHNGVTIEYQNGVAVSQTEIPKKLRENKLIPIVLEMGKNKRQDKTDNKPEDKPSMSNYIILSVNGSMPSKDISASELQSITTNTLNTWNQRILDTNGGIIQYKHGTASSLTPTDPSVTNYIVISGEMLLQPVFEVPTQVYGITQWHVWYDDEDGQRVDLYFKFQEDAEDAHKYWGDHGIEPVYGYITVYPDPLQCQWYYGKGLKPLEIGPLKDGAEEGGKYVNLVPPLDFDSLKSRFGEKYGTWFKYTAQDETDTISKVPILVCCLRIGDKYCVEVAENEFKWVNKTLPTADELYASEWIDPNGDYWRDENGIHNATFTIGIDPKIGDFLLCTNYKISSNMPYQETAGTYIPIRSDDNLSGEIEFKIVSPSYTGWEQNIRQHPTLFRSEKWWTTKLPLMEYVQNIFIKDFKIELESDNGNQNNLKFRDLIYMSQTNESSIKEAEEVTFDIATGLTLEESIEKGISTQPKINYIYDASGAVITSLNRSDYPDLHKAEEFYITDYYNEYSTPKLMVETTLDASKTNYGSLYSFNYLPNKTFYTLSYDYNVKYNTKKYMMKEV